MSRAQAVDGPMAGAGLGARAPAASRSRGHLQQRCKHVSGPAVPPDRTLVADAGSETARGQALVALAGDGAERVQALVAHAGSDASRGQTLAAHASGTMRRRLWAPILGAASLAHRRA
uniref:Uncharacterized protein n=1 Tax=Chlamydomonas euryale TaxID=1486919 RepID=A0A7R9VIY7_9CHLO